MKRIVRIASAVCAAVVLFWYCLPSVYQTLHLPTCTDPSDLSAAPALSIGTPEVRFVRSGLDQRLSDVQTVERSMCLFGFIPVKQFYAPTNSRTVALGGKTVGVVLKTKGVQIVGLGAVDSEQGRVSPAADAGLREGDMITAVNGTPVSDTEDFMHLCDTSISGCTLTCLRDGEQMNVTLQPVRDRDGVYRIGAWVRDSTSGIGTLSFFDSTSGAYAALGHGVTDVDTGKLLTPATGFLTEASISEVRRGSGSEAGELIGTFSARQTDAIASVEQNTDFGISGTLHTAVQSQGAVQIAPSDAAYLGDAYIYSTVSDETVRRYRVRVIRVDVQSQPSIQGMMIEITDPELLEQTGGIVQGMSGSPLVQDGRLIGVVTHVFVSHPTRGYCLYASWMADRLLPAT